MPNDNSFAASGRGESQRAARCQSVDRQQLLLRCVDVDKLIEEDHPARAVWELVEQLDLEPFYAPIEAVEGAAGRPAWDPRVLISLWIYALSQGVSSAREISRLCEYHPAYQWVTGLEMINHHTLSDFRMQHQQALNGLFVRVLGVLSHEGLITLERVMHDGVKVKACAADDSFRRQATLERHLEMARQQVEQMGEPGSEELSERGVKARERAVREKQQRLASAWEQLKQMQERQSSPEKRQKVRASTTDPEARIMQESNGGFDPNYNVQISTDAQARVVVAVGVSQAANDAGELVPAVQRIEANMGRAPEQMVVDGGLINQEAIVEMESQKVDLIGPLPDHGSQKAGRLQSRGVAPEFFPEAFVYDPESNRYTCPAGQKLAFEGLERRGFSDCFRYRARVADCQSCSFKGQCCPQSKVRSLVRTQEAAPVADFRRKMETESARTIYKQRSGVAEFPNAWIKDKIGLRQFRLRGLIKVTMEALWACLTYNICQWIRLCWRPRQAVQVGN
jgi:transposase